MKKFIMSMIVAGTALAGAGQARGAAAGPAYDSKGLSNTWYNLSRAIEKADLEGVKVIVPALIERSQPRNEFVKPGAKPIASQGKTAHEIATFHLDLSREHDGTDRPESRRTFALQSIVNYLKPAALAEEELKGAGDGAPGGPALASDENVAAHQRIETLAGRIKSLLDSENLYLAMPLINSMQKLIKEFDYPLLPKQYANPIALGRATHEILRDAILTADAGVVEAVINAGYIEPDQLHHFQQLFNENYRFVPGPGLVPIWHGRYIDRDGNIVGSALRKGHAIDALGYKRLEIDRIKKALQIPN